MWREGILVSHTCREPAAPCLNCLFSGFIVVLRMLYQPKMSVFDIPGLRLNQLSFWCVDEHLWQILLILTWGLIVLSIIFVWCEVQLALHRNGRSQCPLEGILLTSILWVHFRACAVLFLLRWTMRVLLPPLLELQQFLLLWHPLTRMPWINQIQCMVASSQEASRETENEFLVCSQQSLQPLCLSFHSFSCPLSVWLHLHTNSMPAIQIISLPLPPTALELTGRLEHLPCPFTPVVRVLFHAACGEKARACTVRCNQSRCSVPEKDAYPLVDKRDWWSSFWNTMATQNSPCTNTDFSPNPLNCTRIWCMVHFYACVSLMHLCMKWIMITTEETEKQMGGEKTMHIEGKWVLTSAAIGDSGARNIACHNVMFSSWFWPFDEALVIKHPWVADFRIFLQSVGTEEIVSNQMIMNHGSNMMRMIWRWTTSTVEPKQLNLPLVSGWRKGHKSRPLHVSRLENG